MIDILNIVYNKYFVAGVMLLLLFTIIYLFTKDKEWYK